AALLLGAWEGVANDAVLDRRDLDDVADGRREVEALVARIDSKVKEFVTIGGPAMDDEWGDVVSNLEISELKDPDVRPHRLVVDRARRLLEKIRLLSDDFDNPANASIIAMNEKRIFKWKEDVLAFESLLLDLKGEAAAKCSVQIGLVKGAIGELVELRGRRGELFKKVGGDLDLLIKEEEGVLESIENVRKKVEVSASWDGLFDWARLEGAKPLMELGQALMGGSPESRRQSIAARMNGLSSTVEELGYWRKKYSNDAMEQIKEFRVFAGETERDVRSGMFKLRTFKTVQREVENAKESLRAIGVAIDEYVDGESMSRGEVIFEIQDRLAKVEFLISHSIRNALGHLSADAGRERERERDNDQERRVSSKEKEDADLFNMLHDRLQADYEILCHQLEQVNPRVKVALALASVWSELEKAREMIQLRLKAESVNVEVPHGLDESCNETSLARTERQIAGMEATVAEWQKVMRKAKAERAIAELMALRPGEKIEKRVRDEVGDVLGQVEAIAIKSKERWDQLAKARQILREVADPGRKIVKEMDEIEKEFTDVLKLSDTAEKSSVQVVDQDPVDSDSINSDLSSQSKWLLEKLQTLRGRMDVILASASDFTDAQVQSFSSALNLRLEAISNRVRRIGLSAIETILNGWEKHHAVPCELSCSEMESAMGADVEMGETPKQTIGDFVRRYRNLGGRISHFAPELEMFRVATERTARVVREWGSAVDASVYLSSKVQMIQVVAKADFSVAAAGDVDRVTFLVDLIRGRYAQVRSRADIVDIFVRQVLPFAEEASNFYDEVEEFIDSVELVNRTIGNANTRPAGSFASFGEYERAVEGSLMEFERLQVALANITARLDEMNARSLSDFSSLHHEIIVAACVKHLKTAENLFDRVSNLVKSTQKMKRLVSNFMNQAGEHHSHLSSSIHALEEVNKSLARELTLVFSSVNGYGDGCESVIGASLRHCSEQKVSLSQVLERLRADRSLLSTFEETYEMVVNSASLGIRDSVQSSYRQLQELLVRASQLGSSVGSRLEFVLGAIEWSKRCFEKVEVPVAEQITKLESGDGWISVLVLLGSQEESSTPAELSLESFGRCVDLMVRIWEDEVISLEDTADSISTSGYTLISNTSTAKDADLELAENLVMTLMTRIRDSLTKLQLMFEERKSGLFSLGTYIDQLILKSNNVEPDLEAFVTRCKDVLLGPRDSVLSPLQANNGGRGLRVVTSKVPMRFVMTGVESVDSKNLLSWINDQSEIEKVFNSAVVPRVEDVDSTINSIEEFATRYMGGAGKILLMEAVTRRTAHLKSSYREAVKLTTDEKDGVDSALKYKKWHSEIDLIETEGMNLINKLKAAQPPYPPTFLAVLNEIDTRIPFLEKGLEERRIKAASEIKHRRSISTASPTTPDPVAPYSPGGLPSSPASAFSRLGFQNQRRASLTSLTVIDAARRANEANFRIRCDNLAANFFELRSLLEERLMEYQLHIQTASINERVESLKLWSSKRLAECETVAAAIPPPELLLDDIVSYYSDDFEQSSIEGALHNAVKLQTSVTLEIHQNNYVLEEIAKANLPEETLAECQAAVSAVESFAAHTASLIDYTKKLYSFDRNGADLLTWILAARSAAMALLDRQSAQLPDPATLDEVSDLEQKLNDFVESINHFEDLSEGFLLTGDSTFKAAIRGKTAIVTEQWDALLTVVSTLKGSSAEKERELEFKVSADAVESLLEQVSKNLASALTSDSDSFSMLKELEGEIDRIIMPRLADLREKATLIARSDVERDRYMETHRSLAGEVRKLSAWMGRERKEKDEALKQRTAQRELDEILIVQAEFAKIVQETAITITSNANTNPSRPLNISELENIGQVFNTRFSWYDREVAQMVKDLGPTAAELGMQKKLNDLLAKWSSISYLKENVAEEIKRRITQKRAVAHSAKSLIPRMTPPRSFSSPSIAHRKSHSPLRTPSPSNANAAAPGSASRSSPSFLSPKGSGLPVKIFLPSPNHYVPNPEDPLDVEVARTVNECPMSIKVIPAGEGKGYWFGDLMPRLCYCRIVRDRLVMVRVGGGWQELGAFLLEHSMLEARLPTVRSFANPDSDGSGASQEEGAASSNSEFIVLEPGEVMNPYNLSLHRAMGTWKAKN
ncbi:hypothetical protein HDU76_012504, partial [Blyttiomyces sp. JEL0837]